MCSSAKRKVLTLYLQVSSVYYLCKQFESRSGPVLDPNCLTLQMVFLNYVICLKLILKHSAMKNYPVG